MWSERELINSNAALCTRERSQVDIARAFTLIELLLVMAILTIICAMVAPSLRGFATGRRTNNTAYEIVTLANLAHSQAIAESRRYRLNFDSSGTTGASIWLTAEDTSGNFVALTNDFGDKYVSDPGVIIQTDLQKQQDGTYVEFKPTGRSDTVHITLNDAIGNNMLVICDSPTDLFHLVKEAGAQR